MTQPTKLKHYELLARLGEGGMGVVYRARDTRLGRTVALKVLPQSLAADEERRRRFEREARIASSITHPGVATLYDLDLEGDTVFLTMELVQGSTLRELLDRGPLPLGRLLDCAVQVAEALVAAHRQGVIHRDLKPENVMASDSGHYKVLDFGIARFEDLPRDGGMSPTKTPTKTWATHAGAVIGTVTYMSPEQALGEPVDARSDIFSFGSLLHELATGQPAFHGANEIATAQAITSRDPSPMRSLRPELPEGLELIARKCLAKKPEDRYASADELAEDLRTLRLATISGSRTGTGVRLHAFDRAARRRRLAWIAGAVLLVAAGATGLLWLRDGRPVPPPAAALTGPPPEGAVPAFAETGRPRVIVAFFENGTGDPQVDWLSRGLPEMLTTDLSGSENLEIIATQRLYDLLAMAGREIPDKLDRSTAAELARWAGADIVISGALFRIGDRYRLDAQAYDTRTGTVTFADKVEGEELFALVDELTPALRRGLSAAAGKAEAEVGLRAVSTSSEEAYRAFVRGKSLYDNLMFQDAANEFGRALEIDPEFARARLRLAMSLHQAGEAEAALPMIEKSLAETERMPEAERLLARGLHAWMLNGDLEAGQRHLEVLLERFPGQKEAYVWWARALDDLAGDPLRATKKLRLALAEDPNNLPAVAALAAQLVKIGRPETAAAILEEAARRNPQAAPALNRLLRSYAPPDRPG